MDRLLLATLVAATAAMPAAQEIPLEYRVKAAFLYNFVKYVEWPSQPRILTICVAGQNPFGSVLEDLTRNERVRGARLMTSLILEPEPGCNVLFTPKTASVSTYLRASAGMPILTVGETERFLEGGGIVSFYLEGDVGVRFEINRTAAERVGLRISSRLLQLARIRDPAAEER